MLMKIQVSQEQQKIPIYLQHFDQDKDLWLVGDLRTKLYLQNQMLQKKGYFLNDAHLRARDFWLSLFKRLYPDILIVSPNFLVTWIHEHLIQDEPPESLLRKQSPDFFVEMMKFLGPLTLSSHAESDLQNYFQNNQKSAMRWQHWYTIVTKLSQFILFEKKWALLDWLPHLLLNKIESNLDTSSIQIGKEKIIVDLGFDLKPVEALILKALSRDISIIVIEPILKSHASSLSYLTQAYRFLDSATIHSSADLKQVSAKVETQIFATESAQIKSMFDQSKTLIEKGMQPDQILWLFPRVEKVMPLLDSLSKETHVPLDIEKKVKVISHPDVERWLQTLSIMAGYLNLSALEIVPEFSYLSLEKKRSLFRKVDIIEELPKSIQEKLQSLRCHDCKMLSVNFVEMIFKKWPNPTSNSLLIKILSKFLDSVDRNTMLTFGGWYRILRSLMPFIEVPVSETSSNAIRVMNISEWSLIPSQVVMVGSLVQDYFKNQESIFVYAQDVEALNRDFGYQLEHPRFDSRELDLEWIVQSGVSQIYLMGFHLDAKSCSHALHPILLNRIQTEKIKPAPYFPRIFQYSYELDQSVIMRDQPYQMGITRFETFAKCAFKYHLETTSKFESPHEQNVFDIDTRSEGNLNHKIMELMLKQWGPHLQESNIRKAIIDKAIRDSETILQAGLEEIILESAENFYDRFYQSEYQFRQLYPNVHILDLELPVKCFLDLKSKQFSSSKPDHNYYVELKGIIDRIDQIEDYFVIVDYKRSFKDEYSFTNWAKLHFYQLYFYGVALGFSLQERNQNLKWGGAEILCYKDFKRDKGFLVNEIIPQYRLIPRPKNNPISFGSLTQTLEPVLNSMVAVGDRLLTHAAQPFVLAEHQEICNYCAWRTLCRAPHLI